MIQRHSIRSWASLIWRALIVLVVVFSCADAIAIIDLQKRSFREKIDDADWIYRVRILGIEHQQYTERSQQWTCGTNFVVQTVESFKGPKRSKFTFAAYLSPLHFETRDLKLGDELLVLLSSRPQHGDPAEQPDVPRYPASPAKTKCLSRLSPIRLAEGLEMAFLLESRPVGQNQRDVWMQYARSVTEIPKGPRLMERPYHDDCGLTDCETSALRRVRWEPIREAIMTWTRCGE
jgi:hypothetical protein